MIDFNESRLRELRDFRTPVLQLGSNYFAKLELLHPLRSHKARAAIGMLLHSMRVHDLNAQEHEIIEKTGGNLGVALAISARMLGFRVALAIGSSFPESKRRLMSGVGATLLSGGTPAECIEREKDRIVDGKRRFFIDQFSNQGVLEGFNASLGPQILEEAAKHRAHIRIVKGAGTGASAASIIRCLAEKGISFSLHLVEPEESSFEKEVYEDHNLFGFSVGRLPPFLDLTQVTEYIKCSEREMESARRRLLLEHGLLVGNTSAANDHCAQVISKKFPKDIVITIFYDRGEDYV